MINSINSISEPWIYQSLEDLEKNFEKIEVKGSGGEGCVYSVRDNTTNKIKALKLSRQNNNVNDRNKIVAKKIVEIVDQGLTPHLTKLDAIIGYQCLAGTKLSRSKSPSFFNGIYEDMPKIVYTRLGYLMEIMDGDVEKIYFELNEDEKLCLRIQMASIDLILRQKNVNNSESGKARNILYRKLGPEDTFNGKKLQDFDFWKYVFGEHVFYIPKQKYIFKQADYDPWTITKEAKKLDPEHLLKVRFELDNFSLDDLAEKFKKPTDPEAKIIEIYSSEKD